MPKKPCDSVYKKKWIYISDNLHARGNIKAT